MTRLNRLWRPRVLDSGRLCCSRHTKPKALSYAQHQCNHIAACGNDHRVNDQGKRAMWTIESDRVCLTLPFFRPFSKLSSFMYVYGNHFVLVIFAYSCCLPASRILHFIPNAATCIPLCESQPRQPSRQPARKNCRLGFHGLAVHVSTVLSDIPGMEIKVIRGAWLCGCTLSSPNIRNGEPQPYRPHAVGVFVSVHPIS